MENGKLRLKSTKAKHDQVSEGMYRSICISGCISTLTISVQPKLNEQ